MDLSIVSFTLPVDVDLFLRIGMAICEWHDDEEAGCRVDGCKVVMSGNGPGKDATVTYAHSRDPRVAGVREGASDAV